MVVVDFRMVEGEDAVVQVLRVIMQSRVTWFNGWILAFSNRVALVAPMLGSTTTWTRGIERVGAINTLRVPVLPITAIGRTSPLASVTGGAVSCSLASRGWTRGVVRRVFGVLTFGGVALRTGRVRVLTPVTVLGGRVLRISVGGILKVGWVGYGAVGFRVGGWFVL